MNRDLMLGRGVNSSTSQAWLHCIGTSPMLQNYQQNPRGKSAVSSSFMLLQNWMLLDAFGCLCHPLSLSINEPRSTTERYSVAAEFRGLANHDRRGNFEADQVCKPFSAVKSAVAVSNKLFLFVPGRDQTTFIDLHFSIRFFNLESPPEEIYDPNAAAVLLLLKAPRSVPFDRGVFRQGCLAKWGRTRHWKKLSDM